MQWTFNYNLDYNSSDTCVVRSFCARLRPRCCLPGTGAGGSHLLAPGRASLCRQTKLLEPPLSLLCTCPAAPRRARHNICICRPRMPHSVIFGRCVRVGNYSAVVASAALASYASHLGKEHCYRYELPAQYTPDPCLIYLRPTQTNPAGHQLCVDVTGGCANVVSEEEREKERGLGKKEKCCTIGSDSSYY